MVEVDMQNGSCTGCSISHQMKIPCRHVQNVIYILAKENSLTSPQFDVKQFFHHAYKASRLFAALEPVCIRIPVYDQLENSGQIRPPPLYRQAGKRIQLSKESSDFLRGSKRKKNKGEGETVSQVRPTISNFEAIAAAVAEEEKEKKTFFESQVKAALVVPRAADKCSKCGETEHNKRICKATDADEEETGVGIIPGAYVVGDSPLALCGIHQN
eukprot:jgi/Phyca11/130153/e_gw1.91.85.1